MPSNPASSASGAVVPPRPALFLAATPVIRPFHTWRHTARHEAARSGLPSPPPPAPTRTPPSVPAVTVPVGNNNPEPDPHPLSGSVSLSFARVLASFRREVPDVVVDRSASGGGGGGSGSSAAAAAEKNDKKEEKKSAVGGRAHSLSAASSIEERLDEADQFLRATGADDEGGGAVAGGRTIDYEKSRREAVASMREILALDWEEEGEKMRKERDGKGKE